MVSWNLRQAHLLEVGPMKIPGDHETLSIVRHRTPRRTPCRLFTHEVFFGHSKLHLRVLSELRRSPPFRLMRALKLQWSRAFSLVGAMPLNPSTHYRIDSHTRLAPCQNRDDLKPIFAHYAKNAGMFAPRC